jgi:tRNA uridine 5-carboxymethylaminomethyl modification enzyme
VLNRATSYIGVMIDDLVLQGVTEPYRMLTARAEFRLRLRADNAETRLDEQADAAGLLGEARRRHLDQRRAERESVDQALSVELTASALQRAGAKIVQDGSKRSAAEWLRFPGVEIEHVSPETILTPVVAEAVEDARYAPYVVRQDEDVARLQSDEAVALGEDVDFTMIPGLSVEMIERLSAARPRTLAAAGRVRGVTPAALTAILLQARR